jgi:ATP-dependent protease HslVU (ClpYQ) peptidase subunit
MSTLVIVRKKGVACLGADSLTSFGTRKQLGHYKADPDKVFRVGDSYFGVIGSPAHRLVLESALSARDNIPALASRREIFECFRALHPRLKDEYYLNPKEDDKDPYESSQIDALIVNKHGTFGLMCLREVFEYARFWSIGSGSSYALGAMHAAYELETSAEQVAEIGLKAAMEFDDGTAAPISLRTVKLDESRT